MDRDLSKQLISRIKENVLPQGGFATLKNGDFRTDATAWAVISLSCAGREDAALERARLRLTQMQLADGRIVLDQNQPRTWWPTPLGILAWHGDDRCGAAGDRAVGFMLSFTGLHKADEAVLGHDESIRGWPWIENTHSWVEPTALSLLALETAGQGGHPRVLEAVRMLLDRQLRQGGWNYGNTSVLGQTLRPMPESTGMALCALENKVGIESVAKSIQYLKARMPALKTPFSLGWAMLGLGAWKDKTCDRAAMVAKCLENEAVFGQYNTSQLSLLLLALAGDGEIKGLVSGRGREAYDG